MAETPKLMDRLAPLMMVLVIIMAFAMGVMWNKLQVLEKGGGTTTTTAGNQQTAPVAAEATQEQVNAAFDASVIKFGDTSRDIVFLEIADPSCPYCSIAAGHNPELNKQVGPQFTMAPDGGTYIPPVPEMKRLVDSGDAAFAYIYTPGHGNGEMGTKALYCAFEAGRFWQVHDLLMTSEGYDLVNNVVKNDKTKSQEVADFLGSAMNSSQMKSCLDSGKYDTQLSKDVSTATGLGVTGTPGFFINTSRFAGAYSFADMQSAVDAAL